MGTSIRTYESDIIIRMMEESVMRVRDDNYNSLVADTITTDGWNTLSIAPELNTNIKL